MAGSMWSRLAAMGDTAHQLGQHHRGRQGQGDHQGDGAVMVLKVDPQAVGRG